MIPFLFRINKPTPALIKRSLCICVCFTLLSPIFSCAQNISVIESSTSGTDSSYYDIIQAGPSEYWVGGKYGILKKITADGRLEVIHYPSLGAHILKMAKLDENTILLCGDKGVIYRYSRLPDKWYVTQLSGYAGQCFYNMVTVNDSTAFICGGKSKISRGERAVPGGFILKTSDKGKTWKEVYKDFTSMIWDMYFDAKEKTLYALSYSPLGTRVLCSVNEGQYWQKLKEHYSVLLHSFNKLSGGYSSGGKNGSLGKYGVIIDASKKILKFRETGMIWDVASNGIHTLASACRGLLLSKSEFSQKWTLLHTPSNVNLYELAFINSTTAYVIGSNKTILRVDFSGEQSNSNNH